MYQRGAARMICVQLLMNISEDTGGDKDFELQVQRVHRIDEIRRRILQPSSTVGAAGVAVTSTDVEDQ